MLIWRKSLSSGSSLIHPIQLKNAINAAIGTQSLAEFFIMILRAPFGRNAARSGFA